MTGPTLSKEPGTFSKVGALIGAYIAAPTLLFAQASDPASAPLGIDVDLGRQTVRITFPQNSGLTAIQGQVPAGNLSQTNWFNIPNGLVSPGQISLEIPISELPSNGCIFRGIADQITSNLSVMKEKLPGPLTGYHVVVSVDDKVLRNPDGSIDPTQLGRWNIQNSTDGIHWTDSGYQITPGGTQFSLIIPQTFFISRIQWVPGSFVLPNWTFAEKLFLKVGPAN